MFSAIKSAFSQITLSKRRIFYLFGFFILTCAFFTIRSKYFERSDWLKPVSRTIKKHVHTKHVISHEKVQRLGNSVADSKSLSLQQDTVFVEEVMSPWDKWMEANQHLISIGDIWNKCDNKTRVKIGKIVLEQNNKDGGVKMIMLLNMTFTHDVTAGKVDFSVTYKGMLLHEKEYDFCEECADLEKPLFCPFLKGRELKLNTVVKLPSYIPKGHYVIFSRVKDQSGTEISCINAEMLTGRQ